MNKTKIIKKLSFNKTTKEKAQSFKLDIQVYKHEVFNKQCLIVNERYRETITIVNCAQLH